MVTQLVSTMVSTYEFCGAFCRSAQQPCRDNSSLFLRDAVRRASRNKMKANKCIEKLNDIGFG